MAVKQSEAEERAKQYTEAWCSHNPQSVASYYAEDGRITINGGEPSIGRAAVAEMAHGFFESFPDLVVRMDGFRTSGTHAVFLWSLAGTNTGPGGTGKHVEVSGWEYWRYTDGGLVAESFGHFDAVDYERQLSGS